ncbi:Supervillin [Sarcoptes scabiei]|uniref:Supervillin n=1 Tax=Sarcoptes scabiei TaxID=52283 RepID=A0A834V9C0_SARSC|nr:Supervillin [Sarcoptes scabiei]
MNFVHQRSDEDGNDDDEDDGSEIDGGWQHFDNAENLQDPLRPTSIFHQSKKSKDEAHPIYNLKPILKRKDSLETNIFHQPKAPILPPILKKRDSLSNEINICSTTNANPTVLGNNASVQLKPLSILKNRQQKDSYSFDENTFNNHWSLANEDYQHQQLKPILKKKSWSIDDKFDAVNLVSMSNTSTISNNEVKGILKSSDKTNSSFRSSLPKNQIDRNLIACNNHDNLAEFSSIKTIANKTDVNRTLKSILKSSTNRNRSNSLSPCTSLGSMIENDLDREITTLNYRKRASLGNDDPTTMKLSDCEFFRRILNINTENDVIDVQNDEKNNFSVDDHPASSVSIRSKPKPILKKKSNESFETSASFVMENQKKITGSDNNSYDDDDDDIEDHGKETRMLSTASTPTAASPSSSSSSSSSSSLMASPSTKLRCANSSSSSSSSSVSYRNKSRPKSCFVYGRNEYNIAIVDDEDDDVLDHDYNNSASLSDDNNNNNNNSKTNSSSARTLISERLALLKQNGEEGWKNRIRKDDHRSTIIKPNVIANRLSSLMESQSQWRNRVPEKDARKFTVAAKLDQIKSVTTDTTSSISSLSTSKIMASNKPNQDKMKLRDTPKKLGLIGSSLTEKKLGSISSKLNSVLSADKSPFSSPVKTRKESRKSDIAEESVTRNENLLLDSKASSRIVEESALSSKATISILRPDDEESFGSFFGLDSNLIDQILNSKSTEQSDQVNNPKLDLIGEDSTSIRLLSTNRKARVQAPKRRAASGRNPMKSLQKASIVIDSYQNEPVKISPSSSSKFPQSVSQQQSSSSSLSAIKNTPPNSKFAISALAGLASSEDFKAVSNKLRNSSTQNNGLARNDSWRTYDLKNSLQTRMLLLIKGRRKAPIRLIEPSWKLLNSIDSFILVTKESIYAYLGKFSNIIERTKCLEISELIRKRKDLCFRSINNPVIQIDCQHLDEKITTIHDRLLPLIEKLDYNEGTDREEFDRRFSKPIDFNLDDDDEFYEESINYSNLIYKCVLDEKSTDLNHKADLVHLENICGRSPRHQILQNDQALIFDYGSEMYVWFGKNVSNSLRKKTVEAAKDLWLKGYDYSQCESNPFGTECPPKSNQRPDWCWFIRVHHNMEPILFKDKFFNWPAFTLNRSEAKPQPNKVPEKKGHRVVKKDLSAQLNLFPVDVETDMINSVPSLPSLTLEFISLGRGAGDTISDEDGLPVKVVSLDWQCFYLDENGQQIELNQSDRNYLCSGESYYIRWKYRLTRISRNLKTGGESRFSEDHGGRDRLCYFVWQGKHAKNTKIGLTALNSVEKLRKEGASQIYIEQGREDPVFLRIFQGALVIQSGQRKDIIYASNKQKIYRMFMLNDTESSEEFLVELDLTFKNLRSRMCYIFINPGDAKSKIYLWFGCKTSDAKRSSTRMFLQSIILKDKSKEFGFIPNDLDNSDKIDIEEIEEGKESLHFMEIFNSTTPSSPVSTLKRSSKSNLQRDVYFSLLDDQRPYGFQLRLFQFISSSERIFEVHEIVPSYLPSKNDEKIIISYPFVQSDLYERAKNRPTFFLIDAHYEVFLWESKFPFYYNETKSNRNAVNDLEEDRDKLIDIEKELRLESNQITGFMNQLWLAERKCSLESTLAYCHAKNPAEPPKSYVVSAGLEPNSFCSLFPTWIYNDDAAKLHIQDGRKPNEQILVQEVLSQIQDVNDSVYSYEYLKRRPLPEGINVLCLESYLSDEEFESVFQMNREEFYSLPTWKQKIIKQEKELF